MAGNSRHPGAGNRSKGNTAGSGGRIRRSLRGKGPTPKAEDRVYHPAHKRKLQAEAERRRAEEARHRTALRAALQLDRGHELIVGRNPVVEAVRSGIPLTRVFMSGALAGDADSPCTAANLRGCREADTDAPGRATGPVRGGGASPDRTNRPRARESSQSRK